MSAILQISDGTTTINLIKGSSEYGFHLQSWRPQIVGYKAGGTWQQSALSHGRQIVDKQFTNYIDTFNLKANQIDQNTLIYELQEIRRLLEKGSSYWTTDWQNETVYLIAKATDEDNTRYALIYTGRIPEDENPYSQPFNQPLCASVMDNLTLVIEHGSWTPNVPGTGTCVETGVIKTYCWPWHLEFDGADSDIVVSDNAAIQDLQDASMTAEAWIRPDTEGEANSGIIFLKGSLGFTGWILTMSSPWRLRATIECAVTDGEAIAANNSLNAGEWVHVAFTWNDAVDNFPRIWIGGVEATPYASTQNRNGAINSDVGEDLNIGQDVAPPGFAFDGGMGWTRISNSVRYNATFTPPSRCLLPAVDVNTIGIWIGEESSGATIRNQEGTPARDGTQTDCIFDCDCETEYGNTDGDTCEDEVYLANKQNIANITGVFVDGPAGLGPNLQGTALPYDLLPAVPAVGDAVYFGIHTALADSGPFCSLVFDIGTAQTGITDIVWEYWNGAWVALTVQDNTDAGGLMTGEPFDTTGVNSVHWIQPSDWVTSNPGAIAGTGYWVRARVNTIGVPTPPTQQNRQIYSIVWPYIEIDAENVLGDIPALLQIDFRNQSDKSGNLNPPALYANRVIVAGRSLSRGSGFTPYINLSDEQNHSNITVDASGAAVTFNDDVTTPTGRRITSVAPNSGGLWNVQIDNPLLTEYEGLFHAYVRGDITAGAASDGQFRLEWRTLRGGVYILTEWKQFDSVDSWSFIDFGKIELPPFAKFSPNEVWNTGRIFFSIRLTAAGMTIRFYDLILMPVDEWSGDFVDFTLDPDTYISGPRSQSPLGTIIDSRKFLNIDSITYPKFPVRAIVSSDAFVWGAYQSKTPGQAQIQANSDQRLWFLAFRYNTSNFVSDPWIVHSIQIVRQSRYLSMRGKR